MATFLKILRPAPIRRRLWQWAGILALITVTFAVMNPLLPPEKAVTRQMLGHDFLAFYTAGNFVRQGRLNDLYDLWKVAEFQKSVAQQSGLDIEIDFEKQKFGPWWNPPFYAWVFAPLSLLSFNQAVAVWTLFNIVALGGAIFMLMKMLAPPGSELDAHGRPIDWKTVGLVPFLLILSMPFVQAISHGQNTFISLCILCGVVTCWRYKRAVLAGGVCALLGYKPQLAAVVACVLVCSLGFRALVGLCFVGSALVLINQLTLPGTLVDYLKLLPVNVHYIQVEHDYLWERHATLKGFWRLLFQGRDAGTMGWIPWAFYLVSILGLGGLMIRAVRSHWQRRDVDDPWSLVTEQIWRDRLISTTICTAPLLMPFYFDYDLLLLAIPATLLAAEVLCRPISENKWLIRLWIGLYVWLLINPGIARTTHINVSVILLTMISVMMILRATRQAQSRRLSSHPGMEDVTIQPQAA
jgi:hypothetical protein